VDKEGPTVRLIHFTLQEYLSSSPDFVGGVRSTLAETCLTYLNSLQVMGKSHTLSQIFSDRGKRVPPVIFGQYDNHISAKQVPEPTVYRTTVCGVG